MPKKAGEEERDAFIKEAGALFPNATEINEISSKSPIENSDNVSYNEGKRKYSLSMSDKGLTKTNDDWTTNKIHIGENGRRTIELLYKPFANEEPEERYRRRMQEVSRIDPKYDKGVSKNPYVNFIGKSGRNAVEARFNRGQSFDEIVDDLNEIYTNIIYNEGSENEGKTIEKLMSLRGGIEYAREYARDNNTRGNKRTSLNAVRGGQLEHSSGIQANGKKKLGDNLSRTEQGGFSYARRTTAELKAEVKEAFPNATKINEKSSKSPIENSDNVSYNKGKRKCSLSMSDKNLTKKDDNRFTNKVILDEDGKIDSIDLLYQPFADEDIEVRYRRRMMELDRIDPDIDFLGDYGRASIERKFENGESVNEVIEDLKTVFKNIIYNEGIQDEATVIERLAILKGGVEYANEYNERRNPGRANRRVNQYSVRRGHLKDTSALEQNGRRIFRNVEPTSRTEQGGFSYARRTTAELKAEVKEAFPNATEINEISSKSPIENSDNVSYNRRKCKYSLSMSDKGFTRAGLTDVKDGVEVERLTNRVSANGDIEELFYRPSPFEEQEERRERRLQEVDRLDVRFDEGVSENRFVNYIGEDRRQYIRHLIDDVGHTLNNISRRLKEEFAITLNINGIQNENENKTIKRLCILEGSVAYAKEYGRGQIDGRGNQQALRDALLEGRRNTLAGASEDSGRDIQNLKQNSIRPTSRTEQGGFSYARRTTAELKAEVKEAFPNATEINEHTYLMNLKKLSRRKKRIVGSV